MTDGASYNEQLLECARRNNTELLHHIASELEHNHDKLLALINSTREVITDNSPLHLATLLGNWEFLDAVLDVEGVEIDPTNRDGDTPLHLAVRYASTEPEYGYFIIDNLLDAGLDALVTDKAGKKPVDYVTDNGKLRELLQSAEYAAAADAEVAEVEDGEDGSASDLE